MFIKINKVKKIGVYNDFSWNQDQICNFSKFNLIYGHNYSGKTTLSRIFRCIELQKLHNIEIDATFELEDIDKDSSDFLKVNKHKVKVFNSDFVKENLKWDADNNSINPIFILGEQSIELRRELSEKESKLLDLQTEILRKEKDLNDKRKKIDTSITHKAREIGSTLNIRTFNKIHFTPILLSLKENYNDEILEHTDFIKLQSQALADEQKAIIPDIKVDLVDINPIKINVNEILKREISYELSTTNIISDPELNAWIEEGKRLHEEKTICGFCSGPLPIALLSSIKNHMSIEFKRLQQDIKNQIEELENLSVELNNDYNEYAFYSNLREDYLGIKGETEKGINTYNEYFKYIIEKLESKKSQPFDQLDEIDTVVDTSKINSYIIDLQNVINKNNKQTIDFNNNKLLAIEKIKKHYIAEYILVEEYFNTVNNIDILSDSITSAREDIQSYELEIDEIKTKLFESVKGASQVNTYLKKYFAKDDINIQVDTNNNYVLKRAEKIAKNLSEGEKTAIAFCYFIASLESNGNSIIDTVVYIDDPISSLDSNHLFNTFSFIRDKFYTFVKDAPKLEKHICNCKQLFISTHNFELLNLIKQWFTKMDKSSFSMYIIERNREESKLKTIPNSLLKHKSDYTYLFSIIHAFHSNPSDDFDNLYSLPNIIRRFLESYSSFKFLSTIGVDENLHLLIDEPVTRGKVSKFINYHSHSLSTNNLLVFSDLSECISIVDAVIRAVRINDEKHYVALCLAINAKPNDYYVD